MPGDIPTGPERLAAILSGEAGPAPVDVDELREAALEALDGLAGTYLEAGAGSGRTVVDNERAFSRWRIRPRTLTDVRERSLSVSVLGREFPAPVALAPIGYQRMFHEDGEAASAGAAASLGVPYVAGTYASRSLEAIRERLGDGPAWFQLYASLEDEITASLIDRAASAGYDALVVTVDAHSFGWREPVLEYREEAGSFRLEPANYFDDPAFRALLEKPPESDREAALDRYAEVSGPAVVDREALARIVEWSRLPVLVKGILHPEDARAAIEAGADGVIVSNHGGRVVDNAIPAIEALPEVVDAVGEEGPVGFDSGIRRGADAIVAGALGADLVLLGRPYIYGLAIDGQRGVRTVLENFLADLDMTLALTGCSGWEELDRSMLVRE